MVIPCSVFIGIQIKGTVHLFSQVQPFQCQHLQSLQSFATRIDGTFGRVFIIFFLDLYHPHSLAEAFLPDLSFLFFSASNFPGSMLNNFS